MNGKRLLDLENARLLNNSERSAEFKETREEPHEPVSFSTRNTFLGLPQLKAYFDLEIRFMFRTKVTSLVDELGWKLNISSDMTQPKCVF